AYSANLVLTPIEDSLDVNIAGVNLKPVGEGAFLRESDLPGMKGIFWGHSIIGFVPFLSAQQSFAVGGKQVLAPLIGTYFSQPLHYREESFSTGARRVNAYWKVEGEWPEDDSSDALVGTSLASQSHLQIGDIIAAGAYQMRVTGILHTGGPEDQAVVAPL